MIKDGLATTVADQFLFVKLLRRRLAPRAPEDGEQALQFLLTSSGIRWQVATFVDASIGALEGPDFTPAEHTMR